MVFVLTEFSLYADPIYLSPHSQSLLAAPIKADSQPIRLTAGFHQNPEALLLLIKAYTGDGWREIILRRLNEHRQQCGVSSFQAITLPRE